MAKKSSKGSAFERETCKTLSLWWTGGEREDIFWRTPGSGARATTRAKAGRTTIHNYGDITFTDPMGLALIETFTIELKRGYSSSGISDALDKAPRHKLQQWETFVEQAMSSAADAGTPYWMLLCRRNGRQSFLFMPWQAWLDMVPYSDINRARPKLRMTARFKFKDGTITQTIGGLPFSEFLKYVTARTIKRIHKKHKI